MGLRDKRKQRASQRLTVLGEEVEIRKLSAAERIRMRDAVKKPDGSNPDEQEMMAAMLTTCVYDPETCLPSLTLEEAREMIQEGDAEAVDQLLEVATRINGFGELEKNPPPTPNGASSSG